ncbi:N-acetylgalactosamine-4-sulfatase [bacterium F16]|nr:N-acetylgalactosamine-4-sulfatase [bacterium F16]
MTTRPNVVFILTDDQGYGDLGCHGNPDIKTPNIDAMHAESARFTDYHVGTTCAPTRSGLLTGHYCNSTGVWHTIGGRSLLREDEWTLANALHENGYRTGHFGKWHLGDAQPFRPHERGFEKSIYHGGGGIGNTPDYWGNDYFDDTYYVNGELKKFDGYCTDVFFREGMAFIEEHKDEPFFCYIATNAPHGPLNVEPRYMNMYIHDAPDEAKARFYGMVTNIDENVGKLRAKLNELGVAENTIVVFMTDNGTCGGFQLGEDGFGDDIPFNFNAGMRGKKGWEYEGGHRVPFILHYPALTGGDGRDVTALTSYVDFMPTLLDLCGIDVPAEREFHGTSLKPLIEGDPLPELDERAIVSDTQRLARPVKWRRSCVMQGSWRLCNGTELYDLSIDPGQQNNSIDDHRDRLPALRDAYEAWWETVSEQFYRDNPFALGETDEVVKLTTHDLRNESVQTAWHQGQVRRAVPVSGYWAVDVRKAGSYSIELRRWDKTTGYALTAGIDGDDSGWRKDAIDARQARNYEGGEAIDLKWARILIGDQTHHADIDPSSDSVTFEIDLPLGEAQLYAAFFDKIERTISPYYVYIDRIQG